MLMAVSQRKGEVLKVVLLSKSRHKCPQTFTLATEQRGDWRSGATGSMLCRCIQLQLQMSCIWSSSNNCCIAEYRAAN